MSEKKLIKQFVSSSEAETRQLAGEIANSQQRFVCLRGDLGAGKTAFVKGFASAHGVPESIVKSPTYTYMRIYKGTKENINHFDYYRLGEELEDICEQLKEIRDKNEIVLVEWPERIDQHLPTERLEIIIKMTDNQNERIISLYQHK